MFTAAGCVSYSSLSGKQMNKGNAGAEDNCEPWI